MNSKMTIKIIGLGVLLVFVIVFIVSLVKTAPSASEISSQAKPVQSIDSNILSNATQLKAKDENGPFPIPVPDQTPKDSPFVNLE